MAFLSSFPEIEFSRPLFAGILGNTALSMVPGISGAGSTPERTVFTPILDAELIVKGEIHSMGYKPNTPTNCPTPAVITRSMLQLCGIEPVFVNAGMFNRPTVPCLDVYGDAGADPRQGDAVPRAHAIFEAGKRAGRLLSGCADLLVLGESVPGGTTTALCVLRALGYDARVSSSFVNNPVEQKEEVCRAVVARVRESGVTDPLDVVRIGGDPMMAVAAGIVCGFSGEVVLAGGTQMLSVNAVLKGLGERMAPLATTEYVRADASANFEAVAASVGAGAWYVDPGFDTIGDAGLARYCEGEVKEGMGAGGAILLARIMGYSEEEIRSAILSTVLSFR
ncbi:nicotinate mononucleotide-dependent phosphoribosyltransferase CobT [Methanofollis fontis]|uniref:UPF0284 protein CUJ86_09220 n=1 Tax=Methanofollis fontis TaxID=2052832 RepID=A0A483CTY2_9EURY|nr:TIGR00303 family protein [Methanofollis fontis]TAJ44194.1 TIGR00303 family protein [Methanofollis fontis]